MGSHSKTPAFTPDIVRLPEWDAEFSAARVASTHYFPIRAICDVMGVDAPTQLDIIKNDTRLAIHLRAFYLPGRRGQRYTLCLRRREAAWWIMGIDPKRIKNAKVRGRVEQFQQALMDEADRLIFGAAPRVAEPTRIVRVEHSTDAYFPCPDCDSPLHYHETPDGAVVERVRRSDIDDRD